MSIELTSSDILSQDLLEVPFSPALKSELLKALFGCKLTVSDFVQNPSLFSGYFEFYSELCLHASSQICGIRNHRGLVEVVHLLQNPEETRETIQEKLRKELFPLNSTNNEVMLGHTIDLAARLSLMTFVGYFHFDAGQRTVLWKERDLRTLLEEEFTASKLPVQHVKLEKLFTARNIEQIGGIGIDWTRNLADHLRLQEDDTKVSIFHHASFLDLQQENPLFPQGLIQETILTLSILFPPHDEATSIWFLNQPKILNLDPQAIKCTHLRAEDRQIGKFKYWHDRLATLKQVFDEAEPKSIMQWWRDRRRPVQWYNFWLAIALIAGLTLLFGSIQSVEGGLQVWKAYHPS